MGKSPADVCSMGYVWDYVCSGHFALENLRGFVKGVKG